MRLLRQEQGDLDVTDLLKREYRRRAQRPLMDPELVRGRIMRGEGALAGEDALTYPAGISSNRRSESANFLFLKASGRTL